MKKNWMTTLCGAVFAACSWVAVSDDFTSVERKWASAVAAFAGGMIGVAAADMPRQKKP